METIAHKRVHLTILHKTKAGGETQRIKEFWQMMEFYRFGVVAWTLAIVACLSGVVAGLFVDGSSQFEITMVAVPTVATLVSILAVAPVRWVLGVGAAAVVMNVLLILL